MLAWLSSSVLVPPRFSPSMLISSLWSVVAAAAVMVAKIQLGLQVHRPGSHVSVWSGCNVAISPLNDEELANIARHRQAFLAFLRMDCRVKGNLVVGAIRGGGKVGRHSFLDHRSDLRLDIAIGLIFLAPFGQTFSTP